MDYEILYIYTVLAVVVSADGGDFISCSGHGKSVCSAHGFRIGLSDGEGDEIESKLTDGNGIWKSNCKRTAGN